MLPHKLPIAGRHVFVSARRMSVQEAADFAHVSYDTARSWQVRGIKGRKMHATQIGGRWYTTQDLLEDFLASFTIRRHVDEREAAQ